MTLPKIHKTYYTTAMTKTDYLREFLRTIHLLIFSKSSYPLALPGLVLDIHPRSSALLIIWETFVTNIYRPMYPIGNVKTILDLGAYIGDFSLWATKEYAAPKIISVEPKQKLFRMLCQNIKNNSLRHVVVPVNKAVYSKETILQDANQSLDASSSYHTEGPTGVKSTTLRKLLQTHGIQIVDYVKMDIEGGEKFILTEENRDIFRHRVRFVSAEIHNKWGFTKKDAVDYFSSLGYFVTFRPIIGPFCQIEAYNLNLLNLTTIQPKVSVFRRTWRALGME